MGAVHAQIDQARISAEHQTQAFADGMASRDQQNTDYREQVSSAIQFGGHTVGRHRVHEVHRQHGAYLALPLAHELTNPACSAIQKRASANLDSKVNRQMVSCEQARGALQRMQWTEDKRKGNLT